MINPPKNCQQKGFAIIEMVLYLGLLAIILTLTTLSLSHLTANYQNHDQTNKIIDDLIFLDAKINQAIAQDQDFAIEQTDEFIYWQVEDQEKQLIMIAPPNSLTVKKSPSDFGYGQLLEVTITTDYLPLTTYHYLP